MKKIALLLVCALTGWVAQAQLNLSGSSYTQDFNSLNNGLPVGWSVRLKATPSFLGIDSSNGLIANSASATTGWANTLGGFKNLASASSFATYAGTTVALQQAATDRALGVRQVAQTSTTFPSDTGVAFVLQIANTVGFGNFDLSFRIQSLDSTTARSSAWVVDYGIGASPSAFTPVATTPSSLITGGNTYSNTTVTASFGSALDNQAGPVWIRIVNLSGTSGSGSRPTTAIDDYSLTWTGISANYRPNIISLFPANNSTNVATSGNLGITFDRSVLAGTGNIYITNQNTQTTQTIAAKSASVALSGNAATISGVTLAMGATYHVRFDSTAFDTAGYHSYGIYDTTTWSFTTVYPTPTVINEVFDAACAAGNLPSGWRRESVAGLQQWSCSGIGTNRYMQMNGGSGTSHTDNEDWLISPLVDLTGVSNPRVSFEAYKGFSGSDIEVLYATNYSGGSPSTAIWTNLNVSFAGATNSWANYSANLPAQQMHLAFKYACTQAAANCAQWRVDSVLTSGTTHILTPKANNQLSVVVYGKASNKGVTVAYGMEKSEHVSISIFDLSGREVFKTAVHAALGVNQTTVVPGSLSSGVYVIRVSGSAQYGVARLMVE